MDRFYTVPIENAANHVPKYPDSTAVYVSATCLNVQEFDQRTNMIRWLRTQSGKNFRAWRTQSIRKTFSTTRRDQLPLHF